MTKNFEDLTKWINGMWVVNDENVVLGPALVLDGLVNCYPYGVDNIDETICVKTDDGKMQWVDAARVGSRRRHLEFNRN